jgi:hypothetical protein
MSQLRVWGGGGSENYCINESLVYGLILSLFIMSYNVSLSLSAVAISDAINTNGQNSCIIMQACVPNITQNK